MTLQVNFLEAGPAASTADVHIASERSVRTQLSGHNPMAAVCARGDLDAHNPHPKVTWRKVPRSAPVVRS